jgi:crotonobetainyl-CoA:carnitine CoA-transferase CaiB-like acyl-CoA transferase
MSRRPLLFRALNTSKRNVHVSLSEWGAGSRPTVCRAAIAARDLREQVVVDVIVELGRPVRIPGAPVGEGRVVSSCSQPTARSFFVAEPETGYPLPGPRWRLSRTPAAPPTPAPHLGGHTHPSWSPRAESTGESPRGRFGAEFAGSARAESTGESARGVRDHLAFAGPRVIDLGTLWAGPYPGMHLGALGADVIKIQSVQRPDGFRFSGALLQDGDDSYDRSGIGQATNLNQRDLTVDLTRPDGRRLSERLAGSADVVIENFSARVVEQFALRYGRLRELKPDVIMVRMPGFGLEGPWRDDVGWR